MARADSKAVHPGDNFGHPLGLVMISLPLVQVREPDRQRMGYAVALHFDSQTEQSVLDLRASLAAQGVASTLGTLGERPHISLAVLSKADPEVLVPLAHDYARTLAPFAFRLSAVGTFPTDRNVVFLSPVPTEELLKCHAEFHLRLAQAGLPSSPYYLPGNWIPHCSIEMDVPAEQLANAIRLCKRALRPLNGQFQQLGAVKFLPIKTLANWPLSG